MVKNTEFWRCPAALPSVPAPLGPSPKFVPGVVAMPPPVPVPIPGVVVPGGAVVGIVDPGGAIVGVVVPGGAMVGVVVPGGATVGVVVPPPVLPGLDWYTHPEPVVVGGFGVVVAVPLKSQLAPVAPFL